jgi:hypothetical protein
MDIEVCAIIFRGSQTDRFLLEYCAELRRVLQFTDVRSSDDVADVNAVPPQDLVLEVVPMAPLTAEFEALSTGDHRVKAATGM